MTGSLRASSLASVALLAALVPVATGAGCARQAGNGVRAEASPAPARPKFDGDRAFEVLKKQCDFGPRPVGTDAHLRTRDYLAAEMRKYADRVDIQSFTYRGMPLANVIGVFNPAASRHVLLCAHWDTRPTADMELDAARRRKPILGANDGASGVAVLLEVARLLMEQKPAVGVVIALFDGEDYGDFERDEGVFLGSRHFAKNHAPYKPAFGVLLDMVGQHNVTIYREGNSQQMARAINDKVFAAARRTGQARAFPDRMPSGFYVTDDHIPLNQAGIPCIDLIDFNYGPWHTLDDTPDKCSPASLAAVGTVIIEVVYSETAH